MPQYQVTIRKWNLAAEVPDEMFQFQPPPGARKVELPAAPRPEAQPEAATPPAPGEAKPQQNQEKKP